MAVSPRSAQQLQALLDASHDGVMMLDLNGHILNLNTSGQRLLELSDGQVWQGTAFTAFWPGDASSVQAALDRAQAGAPQHFTAQVPTSAGAVKWWVVTIAPIPADPEQTVYLAVTFRDITTQRTAEADCQAALKQLHEQTQRTQATSAALDAFVNFMEAVGTETDQRRLARQAMDVIQTHVGAVSSAYYELDEARALWRGVVWSDDVSPDIVRQVQAGVPLDAPAFAEVMRQGAPVFVDDWNAERNTLPAAASYGAAGLIPLLIDGKIRALLTTGKRGVSCWTAQERATVQAVGRGLTAALERAVQGQLLTQQRDDLDRRADQLETLLQLTEDQGDTLDPLPLIRRAQDLILRLLPAGFAAYYEVREGRWQLLVQTGDAWSPAMQALLDAGFPVGTTPTFDEVARTRAPAFVGLYDARVDVDSAVAPDVRAHATLPLLVGGTVRGLFNVPIFEPRDWSPAEEAVLLTTVQHLGVAIERLERSADLTRSNADLQRVNQELEAFTYSVSHDLRTPVRHVQGFTSMAHRDLARGDVEKVARRLNVVTEAAGRMDRLLDAMLTLSRVGRANLIVRTVSLAQVVDQVQKNVELLHPDHPVTWIVGALPDVQADAALIEQALGFLLENAVKFSPGTARVHIWAQERPAEWAVFVCDEGVGFDPKYAGRLFGAFQRLHAQEEFQGLGVGLATMKRIVTRHGGQVWADGQIGQGATFGFTLPRR